MGTRRIATTLALTLFMGAASCAVEPASNPTRLSVTTLLTWCGGVMPPPGVPACSTSAVSRTIAITRKGVAVSQLTTSAQGQGTATVEPGSYIIVSVDSPVYEDCDSPIVTAITSASTPVIQTCTVYAP